MKSRLWALLLVAAPCALAARPPALDAYLTELTAVEQASAPASLEPLFAAADAVQAAVMQLADGQAWLETLSDEDYAALKAELRGFVLSRGYDIYAQPDPAFLLRLAEGRGRPVDIAFFTLYRQYWSADYMPVFQRQGDRPTPCVRFNERVIPEMYEAWSGFVQQHPESYASFSRQAVSDAEEIVSLGTCACGDERSVVSELRGFLRRFPGTPVADKIHARLKQLREDPEKLPIRCR